MNTSTTNAKPPGLMAWLVGMAVILFCLVGSAALLGWLPISAGRSADRAEGRLALAPSADAGAPPAAPNATPKATAAPVPPPPAGAKTWCANCGAVVATRVIDVPGETSVLGLVGGAVVGGVLGNQIGRGHGQQLMTAAGAVGGAVAGNEIEKRMKSSKRYETTVRFDNGSTRSFRSTAPPQWRIGERVKVVDGAIRLNG